LERPLGELTAALREWGDTAYREIPVIANLSDCALRVSRALQAFNSGIASVERGGPNALAHDRIEGLRLYAGALAEEVARQFASRVASPSFSRMYDLIAEDNRRETTEADWATLRDASLPDLIVDRLRTHGLLPRADTRLADAYQQWRREFRPGAGDYTVMRDGVTRMSYLLSTYRDMIVQRTTLNSDERRSCLGPIDALAESVLADMRRSLSVADLADKD
jgi:hypothetical protein